ncbi:MAG: T9SS type A sorting domain-containing protein, partial [Calditrichia bacterium]|nr:T9SS type A sorting domain-containing protein [Calditrichia bacterium]
SAFDNEEPSNESALSNGAITPIGYPFSEDFEDNLGLFVNDPSNGVDWAISTTLYIEGSSSAYNPHGANNNNIITTIGSIDLSEAVNPKLSFYQICKTESGYDYGYVEYSTNGSTWTSLPENLYEGEGSYTGARFQETSYGDWSGTTPTNDWWKFEIFDLSSFVGEASFSLRFKLYSDGGVERYGWLIDAVSIAEPDADPIMTVSPKVLNDTLMIGGQNSVYFGISNEQVSLSTLEFTVTEEISASWLEAVPANGSVNQASTENIAVNINTTDLTPGTYSANLIVEGSDANNIYDTVEVNLTVLAAPVITVISDTVRLSIDENMIDSTWFTIKNDGEGVLTISSITDEMIFKGNLYNLSEQKQSPEYEKGEQERTYGTMTKNTGGPDAYGYTWVDSDEPGGPAYNWFDISSVGINSGIASDDVVNGPFDMGFDFKFYGETYNQIYISSNGWITFTATSSSAYSNGRIPSTSAPNNILAPFWDDLNPSLGGNIFYYYDEANQRFIIQFQEVSHYGSSGVYTFQVIINASGSIKYQYQTVTGLLNSSTIGIENADGTDGLEVVYNAEYVHDGLAILFSRGAGWLEYDNFTGDILPGDSVNIKLTFNSAGLSLADYSTKIKIECNDPVNSFVEKPVVIMTVEPQTGIEDLSGILPQKYSLHQNYPNPFNPTTTISYDLKAAQTVTLKIYNLLGEEVRTLIANKHQPAKQYRVEWDATSNAGQKVSSGIYIYRIQTSAFVQSKKMLLLK